MTSEPTVVDTATLDALTAEARRSPRLRMNRNLHAMDDPIHRLLNATEPGTYVAPPPEDCATWAPAASQQDAAAAYLGRLEALVRAAPGGHG